MSGRSESGTAGNATSALRDRPCRCRWHQRDGLGRDDHGIAALSCGTTEAALSFLVGGDDLAISDGQRLRIRFYIDDCQTGRDGRRQTVTLYYAGHLGRRSGDTYLTFSQTLTEFATGPQDFPRSATDTTSRPTPPAGCASCGRSHADSVAIGAETVARIIGFPRTASDTIAIGAEALVRRLDADRLHSDTTSLTEAPARRLDADRLHSDTTSLTDAVGRVIGLTRTASDSIPIGVDTVAASEGLKRTGSDTVSIGAESLTRTLVLIRGPPDTVAIGADTVAAAEGFRKTATDTAAIGADTAARLAAAKTRTASDTTSVTETAVAIEDLIRQAADSASLTESVTPVTTTTRTVADSTSQSDSIFHSVQVGTQNFPRTATDTTSLTDSVTGVSTHLRTASDAADHDRCGLRCRLSSADRHRHHVGRRCGSAARGRQDPHRY